MKRLKIFGIRIWISREPMKVVNQNKKRNASRNSQRNLRLDQVDNRCEVCGRPIDKTRCHIHHTLPVGSPDRNLVDNIRVMCGECYHELEKKPHILGYRNLEDESRYL